MNVQLRAYGFIVATALFATLAFQAAQAATLSEGQAAYGMHDYRGAFAKWEDLADKGNPRALNNLGILYQNGRGVPRDYGMAMRLYRKAAAKGGKDAIRLTVKTETETGICGVKTTCASVAGPVPAL